MSGSAPLRLIVNNKVSPIRTAVLVVGEEQQTRCATAVPTRSRTKPLRAVSAPTGVAFLASRRRSELLPQNAERAGADTPTFSNDVA